jgi:multiple sugar transport system substrate-binding protein
MMGGWMLAIPSTSEHPELAWELLTILEDPDVLTPMLAEFGYLPTQKAIAEDPEYASVLEEKIPFFNEMVKALPIGHGRPNIPQYPTVAENIRMAIEEVYYGRKDPEAALEDAAEKSKSVFGW